MSKEIENKVRTLLKTHLTYEEDMDKISLNQPLTDLNLNSLTFVKFVVALESEFGIEVEDENLRMNLFANLQEIITFIENRTKTN